MRSNNTKRLKLSNGNPAKVNRKRKSIPSQKADSGRGTFARESAGPRKSPRSTKWIEFLEKHPDLDQRFTEAINLSRAGRARAAADILQAAAGDYPDQAPLLWYLGGLYFHELNRPEKALPLYRQASQLDPEWERASLGLFHVLWATDQIDAALEEMKRFQKLTDFRCRDYVEILAEIREKWLAPSRMTKRKKRKSSTF